MPREKAKVPDLSRNIQPFDNLPGRLKKWMFNPPLHVIERTTVTSFVKAGAVPHIFWLAVRRPKEKELVISYASIAYSRGWWCVGKTMTDIKYSIYFTPTGGAVFQGSLWECCRRLMMLPEYPEGMPLDPPTTVDEWYATAELARSSQRWEEIEEVLFKPKEASYEI